MLSEKSCSDQSALVRNVPVVCFSLRCTGLLLQVLQSRSSSTNLHGVLSSGHSYSQNNLVLQVLDSTFKLCLELCNQLLVTSQTDNIVGGISSSWEVDKSSLSRLLLGSSNLEHQVSQPLTSGPDKVAVLREVKLVTIALVRPGKSDLRI
jgi:hypothetical protein